MKVKLLFALVAVFLFGGGFLSGVLFSKQQSDEKVAQATIIETPLSGKNPNPKQTPNFPESQSKVLIGYVQDFRDSGQLDMTHLTHVVFSFGHPTKDGDLLLNGDTALKNLQETVKIAHKQDKKVLLAVGGWYHISGGESYEYFKTALASSSSRTKLVNELINIVERENLDGIDIDFEHPRSKEDAKNLTTFIQMLSDQLKPNGKELTIAVNAKVHSVAGTEITSVVYEPTMFQYVDYVNIMAYDGQWDGGYNAANLAPYSFIENIVSYWTDLFETHQLDKEKLVLGVPFYAQPEDPNVKQVSYATIIKHSSKSPDQDKINLNGTTYHFNGTKTMERKTALALEHGFGGMMIWEAGHDAFGPHSLTASISAKLQEQAVSNRKLYTRN
ncbi:Glycosyl hydrolases family 18 [Mesobacillus persicus]|uniref:chitinase n=1 Tax=Mesobacillus persicus TaxID=930146 RepID=A0A1H7VYD2_9BACI|nr:glycoside hydrolase family 18 protein [Mesobacillus persicus]SEM14276.1 Glycosyl hydrolases family 18 [Mesobacillus persicus]